MPSPERAAMLEPRVHRALASAARRRLLAVLGEQTDLDAAALAERLQLHVNTVRAHLNVLEEAGLVASTVEERARPGRPRLLYRSLGESERSAARTNDEGYRFLATILASHLGATAEDPASSAEHAGRAWGGYAVDRPAPFTVPDVPDAVDRLVSMMDELGFAPDVEDGRGAEPRLVLRRCPFLDVAREHQDVVCSVHLGLMRGALTGLGVDVEVRDLVPWERPDACVAHLRDRTGVH